MSAPFTIGGEVWNGGAKLIEECGEVTQVIAKPSPSPKTRTRTGPT